MEGAGAAAALVRRFYDPDFATDRVEDPRAERVFLVEIEWTETTYRSESYRIRAESAAQAETVARARYDGEPFDADDREIDRVVVDEVGH